MSRKKKNTIFVDFRESDHVKNHLKNLGSEVIEKSLSPADYIIAGEYAFERKQINDFFQSIFDGRLFEQIERMKETSQNPGVE